MNAVDSRLAQIRDLVRSGATEMTGKSYREFEGGRVVGRHGGGMSVMFPELARTGISPGQAAAAIERGKGKVFLRLRRAVEDEFPETKRRKRAPERPVIPAHESLSKKCKVCHAMHGKGQHRFHGKGSFHGTHLFSFPSMKNPKALKFKNLPMGAVFEFVPEGFYGRGPWRKIASDRFRLADEDLQMKLYRKSSFVVSPIATVRVIQAGLQFGGSLFNPRKRRNPSRSKKLVRIYGRVLRVEAQKIGPHRCDAECKRCGHKYFHDFKKGAAMYGLPDGSILIKSEGGS